MDWNWDVFWAAFFGAFFSGVFRRLHETGRRLYHWWKRR